MGFWKNLFGIKDENNPKKDDTKESIIFVTEDEEKTFEESMYGKIQLYRAGVEYIKDIFPSEGYDLERQIVLITNLLEQTNREDDEDIIEVFKELENQYMRLKRLADGEYTIRQLNQQNHAMEKIFEEVGLAEKRLNKGDLEEFKKYISLIQTKVEESDNQGENPLLTNVQRQRFNNALLKAEYRVKMLELMSAIIGRNTKGTNEDIANPFKNLSVLKQRMFSAYLFHDVKETSNQYGKLSESEELYKQFYFNVFPKLESMANELVNELANATMVDDFTIKELFDSKNKSVNSFEFLKKFIEFKLELNDVKARMETLDEKKTEKEKRDAEKKRIREEEERRKKESEEVRRRKEEQEKANEEARNAEIEAKRLAELEKYKNMSPEEVEKEIYRIEHDLAAKGSRFVNILDFQKEVARKKGLLETEKEVQSTELTYKVVDITELETLIGQLDIAGTNYVVFPDTQEYKDGGYLVIVSKSDEDKIKTSNIQMPYSNYSSYSNYSTDEKFGKYPFGIVARLSKKLSAKYGKDFRENLSMTKTKDNLYSLSYVYYSYDSRPRGSKEDKDKIRNMLFEIKQDLEHGSGPMVDLKDVLCYIELPANKNIIPILEKMKNAEIAAFIEPMPQRNRNENNRDSIRIYFRRQDLPEYLETVNDEFLRDKQYVPIRWGDDDSIEKELVKKSEWPSERTKE